MKRSASAELSGGGLKDGKGKVSVTIPNADNAAFQKAAEAAKSGCPISKLLNAAITMDAKLA